MAAVGAMIAIEHPAPGRGEARRYRISPTRMALATAAAQHLHRA
jgi:hypothetical protein